MTRRSSLRRHDRSVRLTGVRCLITPGGPPMSQAHPTVLPRRRVNRGRGAAALPPPRTPTPGPRRRDAPRAWPRAACGRPVHARRRLRRPATRRLRAVDPAGPAAAGRGRPGRHAQPARSPSSGRSTPTSGSAAWSRRGVDRGRPGWGAHASTSSWTGSAPAASTATASAPAGHISPVGRTSTAPHRAVVRPAPWRWRSPPAPSTSTATSPPTAAWPRTTRT